MAIEPQMLKFHSSDIEKAARGMKAALQGVTNTAELFETYMFFASIVGDQEAATPPAPVAPVLDPRIPGVQGGIHPHPVAPPGFRLVPETRPDPSFRDPPVVDGEPTGDTGPAMHMKGKSIAVTGRHPTEAAVLQTAVAAEAKNSGLKSVEEIQEEAAEAAGPSVEELIS